MRQEIRRLVHQVDAQILVLDRDGTINEDREDFVKSPEEWVPLPGALEAVARLNHAGWHAVLATNQSGLGRGLFDMAMLNAMHARMNQMLAKQAIDRGLSTSLADGH